MIRSNSEHTLTCSLWAALLASKPIIKLHGLLAAHTSHLARPNKVVTYELQSSCKQRLPACERNSFVLAGSALLAALFYDECDFCAISMGE